MTIDELMKWAEAHICGPQIMPQASAVLGLLDAIKKHHDQKSDDRCWMDDQELYAAAGLEPGDNTISDPDAMLENCKRFIACRMSKGKWPTYQELWEKLIAVNVIWGEEMSHWPTCGAGNDFSEVGWSKCTCHMVKLRKVLVGSHS